MSEFISMTIIKEQLRATMEDFPPQLILGVLAGNYILFSVVLVGLFSASSSMDAVQINHYEEVMSQLRYRLKDFSFKNM